MKSPSPPSPRLSPLARVLALCLPLLLLLLLCELTLWLLGQGDPAAVPLRGFDPGQRFLVADPVHPGGYYTHMFDNALREVTVLPKGSARRVVLIGGSNTQTFPEALLQSLLDQGDPTGRSWEVINLGREGFGSGRAGRVLEQSLDLDPDVIVVYSGHNEFVELAFERELDALWDAPWQRATEAVLTKLRTYNALAAALRRPEQDWTELGGGAGTPQQRSGLALLRMPYEETLAVHERYRANLVAMAQAAARSDVPLVLCTPVGNLLVPPQVNIEADGLSADVLSRAEELRLAAVALIAPRLRVGLRPPLRLRLGNWYTGGASDTADGADLAAGTSDAKIGAEAFVPPPRLRALGGPLALAPASKLLKAESIEGAHWPDPARWDDSVRQVITGMAAIHERQLSDVERERLDGAVEQLRKALELTPLSPTVSFDLGLCLYLMGDDDGAAVAALRRAVVLDHAPGQAGELSNAIVRELAAAEPGITLLDSAALFAERCPSGLTAYEVLMDRCHLQPGARVVLMQDIAATLLALELP